MTSFIAALPMYDWPERREEVEAEWAVIRDRLRAAGVDAPEGLVRRNADLPAAQGGIRDAEGRVVAPDPATLPPEGLDLPTLWRHPALLLAQTCWGPMKETGLAAQVTVVGQSDYSGIAGGGGEFYSSAILMRRGNMSHSGRPEGDIEAPADGEACLPLELLQRARLAFNEPHSMSGRLALKADLEAAGAGFSIFSNLLETGSHRLSIRAVAEGRADAAAIDCRSWSLARLHEPAATALRVVGWTKRRLGLPFISAPGFSALHGALRNALGG